MAEHVRFSVDTNIDVYFCDPHSPWQRGSNENTNGLLRQSLAKTADLSGYTRADLASVARQLNTRPRQTLGWKKPAEVCVSLLHRLVETALGTPPSPTITGGVEATTSTGLYLRHGAFKLTERR